MIETSIETITPQIAGELLSRNVNNRKAKISKIEQYARDMKSGDWRLNGEAVKVSSTGRLLDGQNRLLACLKSGASFESLVIRGLDDVLDQPTMDTGSSRSYADVLKMRGESNYVLMAAAIRGIASWNAGIRSFTGGRMGMMSNAVLDKTLNQYPALRDDVAMLKRVQDAVSLPAAVAGVMWVAFNSLSPEDAEDFFTRLSSDEGHHEGEPIFTLRRKLLAVRDDRKASADRTHVAAWVIKSWNAYRSGASLSILKFTPGGHKPEKFPEPI